MPYYLRQPQLQRQFPYVHYPALFTPEQCAQIRAMAPEAGMDAARVGGEVGDVVASVRRTRVGWLPWSDRTDWVYATLANVCDDVRLKFYPFNLAGFGESLQLTHYEAKDGGHYDTHRDLGEAALSVRKLSIVTLLSSPDDFDGGALELLGIPGPDKRVPDLAQGTAIAFPSWELHRVTPLTRGERWSLVAWVSGPPFM